MTPRQIELVQSTYAQVRAEPRRAGETFCAQLAEIAPDLGPMFGAGKPARGEALVAALGVMVDGLTDIERLLPVISRIASHHRQNGARPEHHALVGETLIRSLEAHLGAAFTRETSEAWIAAYGALSEAMIDAACPETVIARLSAAE
jgi:hemoglobin-like flavoprotein